MSTAGFWGRDTPAGGGGPSNRQGLSCSRTAMGRWWEAVRGGWHGCRKHACELLRSKCAVWLAWGTGSGVRTLVGG
eukprot:365462-Chlamydomonas_euryale.AAC.8